MEYFNIINQQYLHFISYAPTIFKIKVELMDFKENVLAEITQDISKDNEGSISVNYQQGVQRSCSVTLVNNFNNYIPSATGLIWGTSKFKIYTGVAVDNFSGVSNDIYWFSQGIYVITNPEILHELSQKTITLNGVDKFGVLGNELNYHAFEGTYLVPANTRVKNVITDILNLDMGNGNKIDPKLPLIDSAIGEMQLPHEIKKSPGAFFSEILIDLGNMFACDVFYDCEGYLNFVKGNEELFKSPAEAVYWHYSEETPQYGGANLKLNFTNIYNSIKVVGANPSAPYCEATARNEDPTSPTRIEILGERLKYLESSSCYDTSRCQDFANYLLRKNSIAQTTLSFTSSFIPHLNANKVITITDKYFGYNEQKFIIQSLDFSLSTGGNINVEATNTANIPYFEY